MEILIDSTADIQKYSVKVHLYADFQNIKLQDFSQEVSAMFTKKLQQKETEIIWVETISETNFFVKITATDFETRDKVRQIGAKLLASCKHLKPESILFINHSATSEDAYACVEGFVLSTYSFDVYKSDKSDLVIQSIVCKGDFSDNLKNLLVLTQSVFVVRNLVNEPVCSLNSDAFAQQISMLFAKTQADVIVHGKEWIEEQKMGGLLAVNKGSIDPPRFVEIIWNPLKSSAEPIVLIGKGIVFDTGGLSIKTPSTYMETMKADMGGAAAIVGAMLAVTELQLPMYIHALIPITDNRLSGNAYAPGDVITMHSGLTVEVLNTDAEGRMILADALSYAQPLHPKLVIDVATLTGAANAAVGEHVAVCMGTAQEDLAQLKKISLEVWEPLVEFPIWDFYGEQIKSDIADIKNVGGPLAGSITAGKFLQKFTNYPWIHLDISGSAFLKSKWSYKGVGATGFGVRLLVQFLQKHTQFMS